MSETFWLQKVAKIDSEENERKFVGYYVAKFSDNHISGTVLTEGEKMSIFRNIYCMAEGWENKS